MGEVAVIGGGPAGLMAAQTIAAAGHAVRVFDAMPTVGRKFLMAGKSGLNITHAEAMGSFVSRYGARAQRMAPMLEAFDNAAVQRFMHDLGAETFVGSSGKVFPKAMKASPLLRAWLRRLYAMGVVIETRHRWIGFDAAGLRFEAPHGETTIAPDAVVLALGGASWPKLGSDGAWVPFLAEKGIALAPFRPANCGFDIAWSAVFAERFGGDPVKGVRIGTTTGEFVITRAGIEGSLIYSQAAALRDALERDGSAALTLDLVPGRSAAQLAAALARQPKKASLTNRLRKGVGLTGAKAGLVRELAPAHALVDAEALAKAIKALALPILRPRPINEAISSAGGLAFAALDVDLMLNAMPGVFAAGEMLDWEAPTGGYLLTACLATGKRAGQGVVRYLDAPAGACGVAAS